MAGRKPSTKSTVTTTEKIEKATVAKTTVADDVQEVKTVEVETEEKLRDSDEIAVISLVPHVYYEDERTGDTYEWEDVNHVEYMTFETLKNMWRNHKGYFKSMCLKPDDKRVIKHFGLTKLYDSYEFLMDASNYTKDTISDICSDISAMSSALKHTLFQRISDMVVTGELTNLFVVRTLEKHFNLDLVSAL